MSDPNHIRQYNSHTRSLSTKQLIELERIVDEKDREFQKKNFGQGDYETILSQEARKMYFGVSK